MQERDAKIKKLMVWFVVIIAIALGTWMIAVYFDSDGRETRDAEKYLAELEEQYKNDPYGGETPEETLELFIGALESGDIELASKYFIIDEQEEWVKKLATFQEEGLLDETLGRLKILNNKYPLINDDDNRFIFEAFNEQNELIMQIDIAKGPNNKWKIVDM